MKKRVIPLLALLLATLLLLSNMMVLAEYDEPVAGGVDPISREIDEYILGEGGEADGDGEEQDLAGLLGLSKPAADEPAGAGSQTTAVSNVDAPESFDSMNGDLPDNDALFEGYIRKTLPGLQTVNGLEVVSNDNPRAGRENLVRQGLTGSIAAYDALRSMIEDVAAGRRTSTEFTLDAAALGTEGRYWTADELGLFSFDTGNPFEAAMAKEGVVISAIVYALLEDCPYDMYWYDIGGQWRSYTMINNLKDGDEVKAVNLLKITISMTVAEAYAADTYEVNDLPARVTAAAENIDRIVSDNAGLGDLEKVTAYANKICELVEYDYETFYDDSITYGDPWQLVYIFDGDDDTKVVCEGYGKGFKYLCDISSFAGDVACITIRGELSWDGGGGAHMWNILRMPDGKCYLVDLTNCDAGDTCDGSLFLKGCAGSAGGPYYIEGMMYEFWDYDFYTYGAGSEWFMLSNTDYGAEEDPGEVGPEWQALQTAIDEAEVGATIVLSEDLLGLRGNDPLTVPKGARITLDLAGHVIDRGLDREKTDGCVIKVQGQLTVTDSVGGGAITGGWNAENGGGILVDRGWVTLLGGTITGNRAWGSGGGIYADGDCAVSGGCITDNFTYADGGGVYVPSEGGTFTVSGAPDIENNVCKNSFYYEYSDVYLGDGARIRVGGALEASAVIGVRDGASKSHGDAYVFTSGLGEGGNTGAFFCDDGGYDIGWDETFTEAALVRKPASLTEDGFTYAKRKDGTVSITGCELTGDVVIPETVHGFTVTSLAAGLFCGRDGVTSVTIPATVTFFGTNPEDNRQDEVFAYCQDLEAIYVDPDSAQFCSVGGVLFSKDKSILYSYPCSRNGNTYTVPSTVATLCRASFAAARNLTSLYLASPNTCWYDDTFHADGNLTVIYRRGGSSAVCARRHIDSGLSHETDENYPTYKAFVSPVTPTSTPTPESTPTPTPTPTPTEPAEPTPPARLPINKGKITGIKDQVYTGKAITPTPVVKYGGRKLTLGEDYSVSYRNNKKIGTATVTITGIGDYTGSVKKTFAINPAAVELTDLAGDKKKLTVQWIKGGGGVGYELQYDTSKSFKSAMTVTVFKSRASHTIKKLQSRKKYYVRIRAFKKVGGKMYYSKWSKAKSAKTS